MKETVLKRICLLLVLLFLMGSLAGCSSAAAPYVDRTTKKERKDKTDSGPKTTEKDTKAADTEAAETEEAEPDTRAEETETKAAETETEQETPASEAIFLEDFSVQTIDGSVFKLSEAQKDHELVLINLFATWCGPCGREFPSLLEAWSQRSDRVAVIALTIEETDTDEVLREYADGMGLSFPIGHEEGTGLRYFVTVGIPTTVLVDRSGRVATVEIGAKSSTQEFLDLFDSFTGDSYNPDLCSYTVYVYDSSYEGVAGVVVSFCTDTSCSTVTTDADGAAVFTGPPAKYHVEIISAPDGYRTSSDSSEFDTEPYAQTFWIPLWEEEQ